MVRIALLAGLLCLAFAATAQAGTYDWKTCSGYLTGPGRIEQRGLTDCGKASDLLYRVRTQHRIDYGTPSGGIQMFHLTSGGRYWECFWKPKTYTFTTLDCFAGFHTNSEVKLWIPAGS